MLEFVMNLPHRKGLRRAVYRCHCGTYLESKITFVTQGSKTQCRQCSYKQGSSKNVKHGQGRKGKQTRLYGIWVDMRNRCNNQNNHAYRDYGGRGIYVDPRWDDFAVFASDVGDPPSDSHTLDRLDNEGPYMPGNVRWATKREQANNRRSSHTVTYLGETATVAEWARRRGMKYHTLLVRLNHGWGIEEAMETPVGKFLGTSRVCGKS